MPELMNTSALLIGSQSKTGNSAAATEGSKRDVDDQNVPAFSRELNQALEKQSLGTSVVSEQSRDPQEGESVAVANPAAPMDSSSQASQELLAVRLSTEGSDESTPVDEANLVAPQGQQVVSRQETVFDTEAEAEEPLSLPVSPEMAELELKQADTGKRVQAPSQQSQRGESDEEVIAESAETETELIVASNPGHPAQAGMDTAPRVGGAAVSISGEAPRTSDKTGNAVDAVSNGSEAARSASLTQPLAADGLISQSSLAVRYRYMAGDGGSRIQLPADSESEAAGQDVGINVNKQSDLKTQALMTAGSVGSSSMASTAGSKAEGMPAFTAVISTEDSDPVLLQADMLKDLQTQRAALNEMASQQGATNVTEPLVKSGVADNLFLPLSGGIVAAAVVPRADMNSATTAVTAPFDLPLTDEEPETALVSNIKWMAKEGIQQATATVTPSGMGPISIKVGLDQDQISVSILASQNTTREALDAMLPRLREQLLAQGHESVRLDVSDGRGEQSRGGNGQLFAGMGNPSDDRAQRDQATNGEFSGSVVEADRHVAEDLQRIALNTAGRGQAPSALDVYV